MWLQLLCSVSVLATCVQVATKKQQLHRVLCGGKATTNVPGCCSIIVLTKRILTQRDLCVSPHPNQPFREGSEDFSVPQCFLASVPLTSVLTASNMQLSHVPCRRLNEPMKICSANLKVFFKDLQHFKDYS